MAPSEDVSGGAMQDQLSGTDKIPPGKPPHPLYVTPIRDETGSMQEGKGEFVYARENAALSLLRSFARRASAIRN
jgi:hypothetical protein